MAHKKFLLLTQLLSNSLVRKYEELMEIILLNKRKGKSGLLRHKGLTTTVGEPDFHPTISLPPSKVG
jgi:hypothetical protein